jgi:hypothetical protein
MMDIVFVEQHRRRPVPIAIGQAMVPLFLPEISRSQRYRSGLIDKKIVALPRLSKRRTAAFGFS